MQARFPSVNGRQMEILLFGKLDQTEAIMIILLFHHHLERKSLVLI